MKALAENGGDEARQQPVAGAVAAPIGRILAVDAGGDDHVAMVLDQVADHGRRARRVIGRVAVDQHVNVGIHVGEHAPHDIAFALVRFAAHERAGRRAPSAWCGRSSCCRRRRSRHSAKRRGNPPRSCRWRFPRCSKGSAPPRAGRPAPARRGSPLCPQFRLASPLSWSSVLKTLRQPVHLPHYHSVSMLSRLVCGVHRGRRHSL